MGTIQIYGFNFAPRGWALCRGQLQSIAQNSALFSLLGTTYGGDGQVTFGLPDLQGRLPVGWGSGAGLSPNNLGQRSGSESVTILPTNMPIHNHVATVTSTLAASVEVSSVPGAAPAPTPTTAPATNAAYLGASPAAGQPSAAIWSSALNTPVPLQGVGTTGSVSVAIGNAGGSVPLGIVNPYLVLNFSIALQGVFPSRN